MLNINDLFPYGLSIEAAIDVLQPLALYVVGLAIYAMFVFNFYRFVALRDMFTFDVYRFRKSRFGVIRIFFHLVAYILKYLVVFPLFAFFWFGVLTLMLAFLSRDNDIGDTLLIALATVSAIRFAAYYNEDLARDLAKILPFALLGLFLIDISFFNIGDSLDTLTDVDQHLEAVVYYLLFLIGLELVLRSIFGIKTLLVTKRPTQQKRPASEPTDGDAAQSEEEDEEKMKEEVADEAPEREASG